MVTITKAIESTQTTNTSFEISDTTQRNSSFDLQHNPCAHNLHKYLRSQIANDVFFNNNKNDALNHNIIVIVLSLIICGKVL
jgi:hypothetical protein